MPPHIHSWNFARLSKDEAVALLSKPLNEEGVFLVTDDNDEESYGDKVLYVKHNDRVLHYKIIQASSGNYGIEITDKEVFYQRYFSSLEELLLYHSGKKEDICARLEKPCVYKYPSIWEIKDDDMEMVTRLSHENEVEVWKGSCGKHTIQAKQLKITGKNVEDIEEVEVMKRLNQSNIVVFHGVVVQKYLTIITEYLEWKTFYDQGKFLNLPITAYISVLRQVLNGLAHLQSKRVVHLNFGAKSVLYNESPYLQCKITNFRFSQRVDVNNMLSSIEGLDIRFLPPEVFEGKWLHVNSDVWSFGIFIQEVFTACTQPYQNLMDSEVVRQVKLGRRMERPNNCPEPLHAIARECWNLAPEERPRFESLQSRMKNLTVTLTGDGRPIPMPRKNSQKGEKPTPKPRKFKPRVQQNYTNTTILSSAENSSKCGNDTEPTLPPAPPLTKMTSSLVIPLVPKISIPSPPRRSQNSEYQVKRKELKMISKVRTHLDDEIWEAIWKENKPVLVTLQFTENNDQIDIMKKLNNDNVLKLVGLCTLETPIYIVSEPMKPGSLLTFLRGNKGALEDEVLLQMAIDIAKGLAYLHSHYFIHRDLRADTILLDENNSCKIAHFNYVKKVDEATHTYTGVGVERIAVRWAAPEAIMQGIFSTRSDVWSLGIVLYELVTYGETPYLNMKNADAVKWVADGNRMPQPDNTFCPEAVYNIMLNCWDKKPDSRPSSIILPQTLRDLLMPEENIYDIIEEEEEFDGYIDVFEEIPLIDWDVDFTNLSFEEEIAQGKSGSISRGKLKNDTQVAIKCINVHPIEGKYKQQIEVMKKLNHRNVLQLHGTCTNNNITYIVTQYMQHGNLRDYLQYNSNTLEMTDLFTISCQVCDGMAYLEDEGIIHGNLSAAKILVAEEEPGKITCKIFSMFGSEEDRLRVGFTIRIPSKWMAPETAVEEMYLQQSDIWAFGIVLYEIMTFGLEPYLGIANDEVLDQVIRGYRMPKPEDCKESIYKLMLECWDEDPSKRPSFQSITTRLNDVELYEDHSVNVIPKTYFDVKQVDNSEEKRDDVKLQVKIAESNTGDIWRGTWKGIDIAIKYPKVSKTSKSFELMKNLKNPNILQVLCIFSTDQSPFIVMEYMSRGNLEDYIAWEGSFLKHEKQIEMALQCANGMCFLEKNDITHGNLTARNVLVGENTVCKITGIMASGTESKNSIPGPKEFHLPYKWRSPETLTNGQFNIKSDIWSFGILLHVIMTHGEVPYKELDDQEIAHKVQGGYRMSCPPECQNDVYTIMYDCWNRYPSKRPPFSTIERRLEDVIAYDSMPTEEEWPWQINPSDLHRTTKIADSEKGEIWSGMFRWKERVTILCPGRDSLSIEIAAAELMRCLNNPNILSVFGICLAPGNTQWICTELMSNGQLKKYIQREQRELSIQQLVQFSAQCSSGMLYLEEKGVIHGNLSASRVVVGEDLVCKIAGIVGDGVAHEDPYDGAKTFLLPIKWRAPETIKHDDFTVATDVWSFGILLYEIMSYGRDPYSGMSDGTAAIEIQKGHTLECPPNSPRQFANLLIDCWAKNPNLRPRFDNITLRLKNLLKFMLECECQESAAVQSSLNVKQKDVIFEMKLASGKSGDIWKGLLRRDKPVAIQVSLEKEEEWIQLMAKLEHTNILCLEGVCYAPQEMYIITELMENDNLVKYLRSVGRSLKIQQLVFIAMQVSEGMVYLKSQQVLHRDLCARNVLVGGKEECKITGILGDWSEVMDNPYYEEKVYTPPVKWAAPEAALYGEFSHQSDVWSFGIVLYEIITHGRFPYPGMTRHEVISKVDEGYRMPCPKGCPSPLYNIMRKCWEEDPMARYTMEQLSTKLREYHESLSNEKNKWEVEERDVEVESKIGESSCGEELWRGQFREKPVLIKYHSSSQPLKEFVHEAELLQTLSHQSIISFHGLCPQGKVFVILEEVKSHNFLQCLQTLHFPLSHAEMLEKAIDVARGVAYLHRQGIILRCLSASSIMIGCDNKCKITKFKQATTQKEFAPYQSLADTRWMAIEVLSKNQYSFKSDVWAFGIFLYELVSHGQTPYPDLETDGIVCMKVKDGHRMLAPPGYLTGDVMEECWKTDPKQRPTFDQINGKLESLRTQNNKWEISKEHIVKKESICQEKYGELHKGEWKKTDVVLKYHKSGTCSAREFIWEAEILKILNNQNIFKLKGVCSQATVPFIVFEDIDNSLFTALRQDEILSDILPLIRQIAEGMKYLQQQGVIHRCLMARSVLLKEKVCKICNFSDAIINGRELSQAQKNAKLPFRWIAPESVYSKSYTFKSDVWSFGVLLHEIFQRDSKPYSEVSDTKKIIQMLNTGYRMPCPTLCPQNVYDIIRECWNEDPEARPNFKSIIEKLEKIEKDLKWEVHQTEVNAVKEIEKSGRFSEVWEGQFKGMRVAVKYHKQDSCKLFDFLWEAEHLKMLKHPHIIELLGLNSSAENAFMIMTYMEHGTLLSYLKTFGRSQPRKSLVNIGVQVANGMAYLQTHSIVHMDLAARSVLMGENNHVAISDFSESVCTTKHDNPPRNERQLAWKWLPPEAIEEKVFDMHTDIWSYGILLHEIITNGDTPYKEMGAVEAFEEVKGGYRLPKTTACPEEMYRFMMQCWQKEPSARPTFETAHLRMQRISSTCHNTPIASQKSFRKGDIRGHRTRTSTTVGDDKWEVDRSLVKLESKYEEGRFGEVWKGYLKGSELVAIKIPKLDQTTISEFLHEAEIMKLLKHLNLISLKGVSTTSESTYIITEFMSHGNLVKYMRSLTGRRLSTATILTWASQVCDGMIHLEQEKVIHRDIAARNILLGEESICKIADFGLAQKVSGHTYKESSRTQFPLKWMAPETIEQRKFSFMSDVWAFGILLYEMVTRGALPYPGVQNRDVAQLVKAGYRMPCPRGCPKGIYEIMDSCWKANPEERPDVASIKHTLHSLKTK